jgi:hypothetical protein
LGLAVAGNASNAKSDAIVGNAIEELQFGALLPPKNFKFKFK